MKTEAVTDHKGTWPIKNKLIEMMEDMCRSRLAPRLAGKTSEDELPTLAKDRTKP